MAKNPRAAARDTLEARLGYSFKDPSLLDRALTHISATAYGSTRQDSYQRLEFLGDRVLGLCIAEMLFAQFPDEEEGSLSRRLSELVRAEACAEVALVMDLGSAIRLGDSEARNGGRKKKALLADVCEAVIAAVYLDGGLDAARKAYDLFWTPNFEALARRHRDAKTTLQEWSQERGLGPPKYEVSTLEGPAHAPAFTIDVTVKGYPAARGEGASKRAAQMEAAAAFLVREKVWIADE